jgi:hypothetical protein
MYAWRSSILHCCKDPMPIPLALTCLQRAHTSSRAYTRAEGLVSVLPHSPQLVKQILEGSGVLGKDGWPPRLHGAGEGAIVH